MLIHYEANVASRSHELDRLDSQDRYCVRVIEPSRAEGGVGIIACPATAQQAMWCLAR